LHLARVTGVRTIESVDFDSTVSEVVDYIINAAYTMARKDKAEDEAVQLI
jgi:2-phosphoglycerate kinase